MEALEPLTQGLLSQLQTAGSFRTSLAPPLFPTRLQSGHGGLELWALRLPLASIPCPSFFPQTQA